MEDVVRPRTSPLRGRAPRVSSGCAGRDTSPVVDDGFFPEFSGSTPGPADSDPSPRAGRARVGLRGHDPVPGQPRLRVSPVLRSVPTILLSCLVLGRGQYLHRVPDIVHPLSRVGLRLEPSNASLLPSPLTGRSVLLLYCRRVIDDFDICVSGTRSLIGPLCGFPSVTNRWSCVQDLVRTGVVSISVNLCVYG